MPKSLQNPKLTLSDLAQFLLLFVSALTVNFALNISILKYTYFIILFLLFAVSKKDYIWVPFFFSIQDSFLGLSYVAIKDSQLGYPLFSITSGVSFGVQEIFIIIALLKTLARNGFKIRSSTFSVIVFFALYFFVGFFINPSLASVFQWSRAYAPFLMVFYFTSGFDQSSFEKVLQLNILLVLVAFIDVLTAYFSGRYLAGHLFGIEFTLGVANYTEVIRYKIWGSNMMILALLYSLVQLYNVSVKRTLYAIMVFIIYIMVFLTSTRHIMTTLFITTTLAITTLPKKIQGTFSIALAIVLMLFLLNKIGISVIGILSPALERYSGALLPYFTGKSASIDFTGRESELPFMIETIYKNPIIGTGFSNLSYSLYNNNFGFLNTVMIFGIAGFLAYLGIIVRYFLKMLSVIRNMKSDKKAVAWARSLLYMNAGMLVAYAFTYDYYSSFYPSSNMLIALMVSALYIMCLNNKYFTEVCYE